MKFLEIHGKKDFNLFQVFHLKQEQKNNNNRDDNASLDILCLTDLV